MVKVNLSIPFVVYRDSCQPKKWTVYKRDYNKLNGYYIIPYVQNFSTKRDAMAAMNRILAGFIH